MERRDKVDPAVHQDTEKVRYFRSLMRGTDEWREMDPADFKPFDEEMAREEESERRRVRKVNVELKPVCVVCGKAIPAYDPDVLITNTETQAKLVAHVSCHPPSQTEDGVRLILKQRHCVGGKERG